MFELSSKVLLQKLGDDVVLFRLSDERFFSLDEVAAKMLEVLLASSDKAQAVQTLSELYAADEATLATDLDEFMQRCLREEFIAPSVSS